LSGRLAVIAGSSWRSDPACGIARVREHLAARRLLALIQREEILAAEEDLAAHLEHRWEILRRHPVRNAGDGHYIGGDVLALGTVAARRRHGETPVLIAQRDAKPVDFRLGGDVQWIAFREAQETPDAVEEFQRFVLGENVAQRQHRHLVTHLAKFLRGRGSDLLTGAVAGRQFRVLILNGQKAEP
jgi:hypothetical protein